MLIVNTDFSGTRIFPCHSFFHAVVQEKVVLFRALDIPFPGFAAPLLVLNQTYIAAIGSDFFRWMLDPSTRDILDLANWCLGLGRVQWRTLEVGNAPSVKGVLSYFV